MDAPFTRGSTLFDEGAFFAAHEAWEQAWHAETDATRRRFLQGLIQLAAAFHKLFVMQSAAGASRLLAKGTAKLDACPELVAEARLTTFLDAIHACSPALAAGTLERAAVPKIAPGRLSPAP